MTFDTTHRNRQMTYFDHQDSCWLFGYGSLIWKADFPFIERKAAWIQHWSRRFWQGSHDHRGTPDAPGRVVTLVAEQQAVCYGMAYRIQPEVLQQLDMREKNGYLRERVPIYFSPQTAVEGLIYLATADNEAFLGAAPPHQIAQQIAQAHGPSGSNRDYLLNLDRALQELGVEDSHIASLVASLPRL